MFEQTEQLRDLLLDITHGIDQRIDLSARLT